jgi:hypothetical protein
VAAVVLVVALVAAVGGAAAWWSGSRAPSLTLAANTPSDLGVLARRTWDRFLDAFPARRDCLAPVAVAGARQLDDLATYDPAQRLVTIRIPGTAPNLAATLVHEFAHHLEFTCPAHRGLRPLFLAAQGRRLDAPWFDGPSWARTPSEQFAHATSEVVLGRSSPPVATAISDRAVRAIRAWATSQ